MSSQDAPRSTTLRELMRALRGMEKGERRSDLCGDAPLPSLASPAADLPQSGLHGISTGLPPLDRLLPGGGLRRGTFIEWLPDGPGTGVERLALALVPQALRPDGVCLIIDPRREFFPRGALPGIELERLVVLRPRSLEDALWAAEQSLRCPAVDVVVGWDELLPRGRHPDRTFRRLQLAAEEGGVLGVLLRPSAAARWKCWGDVRVLVEVEGRETRGGRNAAMAHTLSLSPTIDVATPSRGSVGERVGARGTSHAAAGRLPHPNPLLRSMGREVERPDRGEEGDVSGVCVPPIHVPFAVLNPQRITLTLLHCRGGLPGRTLILEHDDETGAVRVVSELADPAVDRGAAGA